MNLVTPLTRSAVRLSAVDPVADGRFAAKEGIRCQKPAEFTLDHHKPLVSTSWFTAEACVSTLEIRVWTTKQCGDFGSKTR